MATFVAKSPCAGSRGRSSSTSAPTASPTRAASRSTALDTAVLGLEQLFEPPDLVRRADADDHVGLLEHRLLRRAHLELSPALSNRDDAGARLREDAELADRAPRGAALPSDLDLLQLRAGCSDVVIALTNDVTCGRIISCAITRPAVVYGVTTRSAPASFSFRSASSLEPRAITVSSGRRDFTDSVMYMLSPSSSEETMMPRARSTPALTRSSSSAPLPSTYRSSFSRACASASSLKSRTTYGTPASRSSSPARRPTRP